jgi:hypothetical protein
MPSTVLDFDASAPDISADRRHCAALVTIERDLRVPFSDEEVGPAFRPVTHRAALGVPQHT